jgi:hypothetical protein
LGALLKFGATDLVWLTLYTSKVPGSWGGGGGGVGQMLSSALDTCLAGGLQQFCGSGMFIPDSEILIFTHPGSRIPDPETARKERGFVVILFYVATNSQN